MYVKNLRSKNGLHDSLYNPYEYNFEESDIPSSFGIAYYSYLL